MSFWRKSLLRYQACASLCAITFSWLGGADAAPPAEPEVTLVAEVRIPNDLGQPLRPLASAKIQQGQEILYTVQIRNATQETLASPTVIQAIPLNTHYVLGSATGAGADIQFSADGGRRFAPAAQWRTSDRLRPLPAEAYTHIRWQLRYPLAPGSVVLARFRAVFQ